MGKHLSDAELRSYHDDGFVFPIDVLSPREALDCRRRLEAFEAEHGAMKYAMKPYLTMLLADELAHHPVLLAGGRYTSLNADIDLTATRVGTSTLAAKVLRNCEPALATGAR